MITPDEAHEKLLKQSDAIDLIAKELIWLLAEVNKKNPQPETPLGEEILTMFFSLYKDYLKVKNDTFVLRDQLDLAEFEDQTMGMLYKASGRMLARKVCEGLFKQFVSVAETGELPEDDFPA